MNQPDIPTVRDLADALRIASAALATTRPGCTVTLTPRVLQLLRDAAESQQALALAATCSQEPTDG